MKLRSLSEFLALAECLDVSIAGRKMGVSSTNLLRHVRELEAEFQTKLIEQDISGIRITAAGKRLAAHAGPLVGKVSMISTEIVELGMAWHNTVRVGFIGGAMNEEVVQTIDRLRKRYPELVAIPSAMPPGLQLNELREGRLDVAVIGHPGGDVGIHFDLFYIGRLTLRLILPASSPLAGKRLIKVEELRELPFIGMNEKLFPGRQAFISRVCEGGGFKPRFVASADSPSSMLTLVAVNQACGMAPDTALRIDHAGTVFRAVDSDFAFIDCCAAVARGESRPMVTRFLNQMRTDHAASAAEREKVYQDDMDRLGL